MSKAAITIKEVKSPIGGETRGYRIIASVVNSAMHLYDFGGRKSYYVQSHMEKYNIRMTLDYVTEPSHTGRRVAAFIAKLKAFNKVTEITWDKGGKRQYHAI